MTKNPVLNALAAFAYIVLVSFVLFNGGENSGPVNSFFMPVAIISLFTLSAAVMGYIFCLTPVQLYIDSKKKEGVALFLKTLFMFAVITAIMLSLIFSHVFPSSKPKVIEKSNSSSSSRVGVANPASVYCTEQGGESTIVTAPDGSQSGLCTFPDGRRCDEWTFFRTKACK